MNPEQWKQVKLLFEQVMVLEPSEEDQYLEKHCQDEFVRKEVKSLIMSHRQANDFLAENQNYLGATVQGKKQFQDTKARSSSKNTRIVEGDFSGNSRFLIQRRLGAGGFGVVYQAYDRERNSVVALKTLHQTDADDLYRFKKEFRALADIVHPNLAAMYELFSEAEQWFFTMEMIYGKDFFEYVKTPQNSLKNSSSLDMQTASVSSLSVKDKDIVSKENVQPTKTINTNNLEIEYCNADIDKLRSVLKQLTEGLSTLHKAGKLHRDIKPSNVLVTKEGRVVILDFGLISDLNAQGVNQVSSGNVVGTPAYMSPEHIAGNPISPASDWYSVGIMLYLALTGKLPFNGSQIDILLNKQKSEPQLPSKLVKGIPEDLDHLCQKLLQRNPRLRPTPVDILNILGQTNSILLTNNNTLVKQDKFVGREKELKKLNEVWQLVKQGQGATIYVKGCSGMGKTATVQHFLEKLQANEPDLLVFSGRCYEQEFVPYKAIDSIIDNLSKYLRNLPALQAETLLPLDILALARLFPVLKQIEVVANSRRTILDNPDSQDLRRKAFTALRELLARLANKKDVILFIDDLQWGDLDSVGLLSEIMRPPDLPRLLFIGSYRSEEANTSSFLKSLFLNIKDEKLQIQEIAIEELSITESQQLLSRLLTQENLAIPIETIVKEASGCPFFIGELAQYTLTTAKSNSKDQDEMTIDKVVKARIGQLPENSRCFLEIIAVAGQPLARSVAKRASKTDSDEQILLTLKTNHLIRLTGNSAYEEVDTYHDRIREAILGSLSEETLKDYHYSLALALEETSFVDPERLAKHFQLAGERDKASDYTIAAAQKADEALAFDRAAQLYQQSLDLKTSLEPKTVSLKIKLGNALSNAGKGAEAAKVYLAATADSHKQGRLKLQHKAAEQFLNAGYIDEGLELLNVVLKKVGMKLNENSTSIFLSILLERIKLWLKGLKYQEREESQISPNLLAQIDVCWTAVDSLSSIDSAQAIYFQNFHIMLSLNAGEPYRLVRALSFESLFCSFLGNWFKPHRIKTIEMASTLAQKINKPELLAMVTFIKCTGSYMDGDWKTAWELFCEGEKITLQECKGENYVFALRGIDNSTTLSVRALYFLGNIAELIARLSQLVENAKEKSNLFLLTNLRTYILHIKYLTMDEPERAYEELNQASDSWTKRGFHVQHYWKFISQGEIGLYLAKGLSTWKQIDENWKVLEKSIMLNCPNVFIEAMHLQARVALAASIEASNPNFYLSIAKKNASKILSRQPSYGKAWAELILAGVSITEGNRQLAIDYLTSAEKKFESANMQLYATTTRYRLGELLGTSKGEELIKSSNNWMQNQKIKNPTSMFNMLAPGKWSN